MYGKEFKSIIIVSSNITNINVFGDITAQNIAFYLGVFAGGKFYSTSV